MLTKTICDIHGAPCDSPDDHLFIGAPEPANPDSTDSVVYYGKHDSKTKIGYLIDLHTKACPHRECTLFGAEGYDAYDQAGYYLGHATTIEETPRLYFTTSSNQGTACGWSPEELNNDVAATLRYRLELRTVPVRSGSGAVRVQDS